VFSALALVLSAGALAAPAALHEPYRVVVEPTGNLLVADGGSGRIVRVDARTGEQTVWASGLGRVFDLTYGPNQILYAAVGSRVVRFSGSGRPRVVTRGLRDPTGLAVARKNVVYVVEAARDRVIRIGPGGVRQVVASKGLDQPLGISLVGGGMYVSDSHHGRIVRILAKRKLRPVVRGLALPVSLSAGPDGSLLIVDHVRHDQPGKILRRNRDGSVDTLSSGSITALTSVAVAPDGTLYATAFQSPFVGRVDAEGRLRPLGVTS
jgi:DNA-binding beta-propeller fold protein YncE